MRYLPILLFVLIGCGKVQLPQGASGGSTPNNSTTGNVAATDYGYSGPGMGYRLLYNRSDGTACARNQHYKEEVASAIVDTYATSHGCHIEQINDYNFLIDCTGAPGPMPHTNYWDSCEWNYYPEMQLD